MCKLAKVWVFVVACLFSFAAQAQVAVISGQTISQTGQPLPGTLLRVCSATSTGVPCNPTTPIFYDYGLTQQAPNPFTSDQYGNYTFYGGVLPAPNLYTVQYSPGPDPVTGNPVTWAYVVDGPFLSAAGGTVTGFINALGYNGVPEADQCSGVDANAKINTCAGMIPNGGVEDARGFGATTQPSTTVLTALSLPTRPIHLELNPATVFQENAVFSGAAIAAGTACEVPIGQGSSIETLGLNGAINMVLGPAAATFDLVCNATQDGTQESFRIDGLGLAGNATAQLAGSLLHVKNVFAGTEIKDVYTYAPFGNALTDEGGSDHLYINDNFSDGQTTGGYAGAVVNLLCPNNVTFEGGAIQFNGANNALLTMAGISPTDANCVAGTAATGVHMYNVDFETLPATVGSFAGAPTNVDPIQITDGSDILIDKLHLYGNRGAGQLHIADILSSGLNGQARGPVEIDNVIAATSTWGGSVLISNQNPAQFVAPTQVAVSGTQLSASQIGIGKYRWEGNSNASGSATDNLDSEVLGTIAAVSTNGVLNAALQNGADIGAKVNAAITQCGQACTVYVPAGLYNFTTPIMLPMTSIGHLTFKMDDGVSLVYNGVGCAITSTIDTGSPTVVNLRISGGQLYAGTGSPTCGIHIQASNGVWIDGMVVYGFAAGQGIWVDGANGVWIQKNLIATNGVGVFATNTHCSGNVCSPTGPGSPFTPNAVHIVDNDIPSNSQWGVQFYDEFTAASEGALNGSIEGNDLELNGSGGSQYGAVSIGMSTGMVIEKNYFEGSPLAIQAGLAGGSDGTFRSFASRGLVIRDNYFTLGGAVVAGTQINLLDTDNALIEGNATLGALENTSSCFINSLARSGSNIGETNTYYGKNAWYSDQNTGQGNYTCVGEVPGPLVGAGTFPITNTNYNMTVVNQNYEIMNSGTSETVAVGGNVVAGSPCTVAPFNQTAVTSSPNINPSFYVATGANTGTLYHPASIVGLRVTILCASGPFN